MRKELRKTYPVGGNSINLVDLDDSGKHLSQFVADHVESVFQLLSTAFDPHIGTFPPTVYHYTSLDTFCKILEEGLRSPDDFKFKNWRGGNLYTQNDPQEGKHYGELESKLLNRMVGEPIWAKTPEFDKGSLEEFSRTQAKIYALSMSTVADGIELWTRYGDDGKGVAVEFDAVELSRLSELQSSGFGFFKVYYSIDDAVSTLVQVLGTNHKFLTTLRLPDGSVERESVIAASLSKLCAIQLINPFCKSHHYASESEWRLTCSEVEGRSLHFTSRNGLLRQAIDIEIPTDHCLVKSVRLGPRSSNEHNRRTLQNWLSLFPHCRNVEVFTSDVPYVG